MKKPFVLFRAFENWRKNPLLSRLSAKLVINRALSRETWIKLDSEKKRRFNEWCSLTRNTECHGRLGDPFLRRFFHDADYRREKTQKITSLRFRRLTTIRATISSTRRKRIFAVSCGNTRLLKICVAIDNFNRAKAICQTTFLRKRSLVGR